MVFSANALEWPSENGIITGNFGWNDEGRPLSGIVFKAEGSINATGQGEILFLNKTWDNFRGLPSPLGTWLAINHNDGIISVYSRMDESGTAVNNPLIPEDDLYVGMTGKSGWPKKTVFTFSYMTEKKNAGLILLCLLILNLIIVLL